MLLNTIWLAILQVNQLRRENQLRKVNTVVLNQTQFFVVKIMNLFIFIRKKMTLCLQLKREEEEKIFEQFFFA